MTETLHYLAPEADLTLVSRRELGRQLRRIEALERALRDILATALDEGAEEVEATFATHFACVTCLDTGVSGFRAADDAPLACTCRRLA